MSTTVIARPPSEKAGQTRRRFAIWPYGGTRCFPRALPLPISLGFTTQIPKAGEIATSALSLPRKLVGKDTRIHTRRPQAWATLSETDAALLDFLRHGAEFSELSPENTIRKLTTLLSERGRLGRILTVADSEPPRVRAMLGALAGNWAIIAGLYNICELL